MRKKRKPSQPKTTVSEQPNLEPQSTLSALGENPTPTTRHGDCFYLCSYNARTVCSDSDLNALLEAVRYVKFQVIALQDTRSRRTDIRQLDDGTLIILGGRMPSQNVGGVGFVIHPSVSSLVTSRSIVSPRLAILRLKPQHQKKVSIINCFSPSSAADKDELDAFYRHLEEVIHNEKCFYKFVVGSFDAVLGKALEGECRVGKFGLGDRDENGNRLAELLPSARLIHGNSFFQKPEKLRWTWQSSNGAVRAEVDHILTNRRWCLFDVSVVRRVQTGSGHRLLRAKIRFDENLGMRSYLAAMKGIVNDENNSNLPQNDLDVEEDRAKDCEKLVKGFQNCIGNVVVLQSRNSQSNLSQT